ncbi:MAG: endopeptidase La [Planctomycetes bacterium]|nr:endopeptidase La [Planctomycetota bacterium]
MPLRDVVVFPGMMIPLLVSRDSSIQLVDDVLVGNKLLALVLQREPGQENPGLKDLHGLGTGCIVLKMVKFPDSTVRILVQGLSRVHVDEGMAGKPYLVARVRPAGDRLEPSREVLALDRNVTSQFQKFLALNPQSSQELQVILLNIEDPGRRADLIGSALNIALAEKQRVLEALDVRARLQVVSQFLGRELELAELSTKLESQVETEVNKSQREYFLREKMKAIQKELGEGDERAAEVEELKKKLEAARPPEEARQQAERELERLARMAPGSPEYTVSRNYLDWILALPWQVSTEDNLDIRSAEKVLQEDHAGLEKVKDRILEYLAVRKLKKDMRGPILCFLGPPGVGKTSLGRSIARALGRRFVRLSLGGVRDEAEIRGHRRTYIGALPGRILQSLRRAGTNNPLFMLDEIDKLGADFRGDPSSALLEVLDPEQNFSFSDHYLELPFDLSRVMFITTANLLEAIPPALRDRMEVLHLPGYTLEEKQAIARGFLIPRQLQEHGLTRLHVRFVPAAVRRIIQDYTREAGVRNLEREVAAVCRKIAKQRAYGNTRRARVTAASVPSFLGPPKFDAEVAERTRDPGVVTGLAWTQAGGEILFIESTKMPGRKVFKLTGQLGDVMKESAEAALSYVQSRADTLSIPKTFFEKHDLHIHVPGGAVPKDGPSAGLAMAISLVSLAQDRPVRPLVAVTGEITLRGRVLPVGGIKEKVLAAHRAGIKSILLPARNQKDLEDIPQEIRKRLEFHFCETIQDAIDRAMPGMPDGDGAKGSKGHR